MDWGAELWDQFENVDKHLQHNIDFGEKYAKFVKERCSIEMEYATKMRKLVKSFQPKKREEDRSMFSTHKAFQNQLSELNDIAGQHETVAEEMMSNISKNAQAFYNELKVEKKKLYQDGRHLQSVLDQHERTLEQFKKKFEKEWKECERAQSYFEKLDADTNVTKADVEKAKHMWTSRKDTVESCKTDYGAFLQQFNTEQSEHYQTAMPKIFANYRDCDEKGIHKFKELMIEYAKIEQKVKPIIQKCLDGMDKAANAIDAKLDANLVVERLKSGFMPPGDKEFEDYTSPQHGKTNHEEGADGSQRNSLVIGKPQNRKGGLSWLFGPKKVAESPDFSHLPPEQRRKKLQKQIEEIRKELTKEDDGRKAILKMQDVYRSNPALGDAGSLENQINMATQKINKLQADLSQHEAWYSDATATMKGSPSRMSRPAPTETQPSPQQQQQKPVQQPLKTEATSKSSGLQRDQSFGDDFDEETEPIGTAVALYDFEAGESEGALSMKAGQEFLVLEADSGDGWTRAMCGDMDGYVPTTYIEVKFYT